MSQKDLYQELEDLEAKAQEQNTKQEASDLEKFDQSGYTEERDLVNRLLGRVQVSNAMSKLAEAVKISELAKVKENKLYRSLKGSTVNLNNGETADLGTWAGFCKSVGLSRSKVDEDIQNLQVFGEATLTAMNAAGFGYHDIRKLRQLPNEDRSILVNEIEANLDDKDSILGLIDGISAKHVKEKEALNNEINELKQKDEINERLFADKDKKINELDRQLDRLKNKVDGWHPRTFEISMETTKTSAVVLEGIDKLDILRDVILNEDFGEEDRQAAINAMAVVYYDAVSQIMEKASWLMGHCNEVFEGYKQDAMPLIDMDIYNNPSETEH